ncbi:MAG TPA: hypothetical protein VF412_18665 [Bdellovibrio sp.]|uniref:hypothetical protein n=1 Tax=Bdellovibrio sp. TaxID=28201 RepID=UPI002EEB8187
MKTSSLTVALLIFAGPFFSYAMPDWAKNSTEATSTEIITTCSGEGPSLAIARNEAVESCTTSAIRLQNGSLNYKSYSVQTESDSAAHETVSSNLKVSGALCKPTNEEVEQRPGQFRVWLKCAFKKADFKLAVDDSTKASSTSEQVKVKPEGKLKSVTIGKHIKDLSTCQVSLSVIPECESVLVKSSFPRIERCKGNPVRMAVHSEDVLVVRAAGYKPQEIQSSCNGGDHVIEVILEPL